MLVLGPASTCTAAYILQSGQRAAADQQGTANRQVADVGRFPHSASIWELVSLRATTLTLPAGWARAWRPLGCVIIPNPSHTTHHVESCCCGVHSLVRGPLRLTPPGLGWAFSPPSTDGS